MPMVEDLYEVLEVTRDASSAQIKAAHRRLIKTLHPDAGGGRDDFDRVQHAFECLHDPVRRKKYDETGADGYRAGQENLAERQAMEVLAQKFMAAVHGAADPDRVDLLTAVRRALEADIAAIKAQVEDFHRQRAKVQKTLERLSRKKKAAPDILRTALTTAIRDADVKIASAADALAMGAAALEMLGDYTFSFDAPPPYQDPRQTNFVSWIVPGGT